MKYSLILSTIFFLLGFFYMVLGAYTVASNTKSGTNRLFLVLTSSMAVWAFTCSISNSAPTAEFSAFWACLSVFGWGVFYNILLHFTLIMTNSRFRPKSTGKIILFYLPAAINIILFAPYGILAEKQYKMEQTDFGWRNTLPANLGQHWINTYYIIYLSITFTLLIRWLRKLEPKSPLRRQVRHFILSMIFPFIAGTITDIMPEYLGLIRIPKIAITFLFVPTYVLYRTLKKHGILLDREREEFSPAVSGSLSGIAISEESRFRLFETATAAYIAGALGSFYTGYFLAGNDIVPEFILAFSVFVFGVTLRFVPYIIKNPAVQNTVFLITGIIGMFFFIITNIRTAAVTIWSAYIIILLFTVVFNSEVHALIFLGAVLLTQIVLWILYPRVEVIIDGEHYLKRIIIISLSFYAVRYLSNEYKSKLQGYQRFSREQEMLEKVSSSFISISSENGKEKIDKMLEIISEILRFDYAYIIRFGADYKDATFMNMYVKDPRNKSSPFKAGMKLKTSDLPILKSLIAQNAPMLCEDLTGISFEETEYQKSFFLSRGIKSFFALPITVDNSMSGIFVTEYCEKSDRRFTEGRLHFLKIIANILGDARRKLLYEEMLYNFAYFDEVTKLANRNMLKRKLTEMISDNKEDNKIAVLEIELENLRMINDTFGHAVGEQVMIESANVLKNLLKDCCYLSRTGEGSFTVVLSEVTVAEQIDECAGILLSSFSHPIATESGVEALFVIARIGISVYPDHGMDADSLLKSADLAVYEARNTERDYVIYTDRLEGDIAETTQLTNKLFRSLENKEFLLEFQPQISCETEKTVGIEALLRWTTDDNRRIPPNRFVPILEQTGLIYDVGLWVLEESLKEQKELVEKGFPPLRVSVNLSIVQFDGENFISDFTRVIKESGVDPKYIELEIT
ncbi:MAG: diguanylate cyclase, partial [Ruminococcaceae bacterium]|nr:diguanylate cyclase [Oscillospiraceae bacterium]